MNAPTLPEDLSFAGEVALLTGAGGAIGAAIHSRLVELGAEVVLSDREPAADRLGADIRDPEACQQLVAAVLEDHGGLDLLVNCAGVMARRGPLETDPQTWSQVLDVNLLGTFQMCCAAHAGLAASGGRVVNISSTHAHLAARGSTAYSVSKAGVSHLTRLLALEWAGDGIRVNAVAPTVVPSAMTADVLADESYLQRKFAAIPLGRPVRAEEVAAAVAYAASRAAGSLTGQVIVLDGGEGLA